jgi:very-short-patch-repair endonuclease
MFQCTRCEKTFNEYDQLRRHTGRIHKIHTSELYVETYLNGEWPLCKCGCGERVKWRPEQPTHFMTYVMGHNARGDSNPIHTLTEEQWKLRKERHSATNKAQFASGERKMWSEGKSIKTDPILQQAAKKISENKERGEKISKALKGIPHSEEHNKNSRNAIIKAWENEDLRERQRQNRAEFHKNHQILDISNLEKTFMEFLLKCEIEFKHQVNIKGFIFDFLIGENILIEVDGDFYHCHPDKFPIPLYPVQKATLKNDKRKSFVAQELGYTLLRFWESDINNDPELVKSQLMNYISGL